MTKQRSMPYETDKVINEIQNTDEAAGDASLRLKNKLLADETCRLLCGDSTSLFDDIFSHPLSIDYFNIYLSLPIFGQRVLCHRITHQLDFDPPLLAKHQMYNQISEEAKQWLIHCRLNNYVHTDIYIESLLGLLLINSDNMMESSSKLHVLIGSKEGQSHIFSTVTDVRQFHQFLQSTSGIKYWNFFIDSMRLLRSRYSSQSNRIDISHLNFIYKYYSQQNEFRSIMIDLNKSLMPDSSTSNAIWFQMAINAMHQLRIYWLPRYLNQLSLSSRLKLKHSTRNPIKNNIKSSSKTTIAAHSNHLSHTDPMINESKLVKFTLGNISYLNYNPRQYILTQSSEQHTEEFNESDNDNNNHQIETECKMTFECPLSDHSIEEYSTDANIELVYRILVSDSLAGSPFSEYISQIIPKPEVIPLQTCIRFITDAEVLLSMPVGNFKERILKQFISRYLEVIATDELPYQVFDNIEEQRIELIKELISKDDNQYPLLWIILLKIAKFLTPHFLNYIKFDRLRFLVQGKSLNTTHVINDLCHLFPSVNFETLQTDQHNTKETHLKQANVNNCDEQFNDLLKSLFKNQYHTTEKLINTDEQCEFRTGERFPPLTDDELQQELRQFCTKIEWKDIQTILGNSFDAPITSHQPNITTFIGDPLSHNKINQTLISNEYSKLNSAETFTLEIMNSAREIFEVDRYISNAMDESLNLLRTNDSSQALKTNLNSSPLSSVFEEILPTDSSPTTSLQLITNDINTNALAPSHTERNPSKKQDTIQPKFLSLFGSYFINSPSITSQLSQPSQLENTIDPLLSHGLIKELTIDNMNKTFFHESIKFAPKDKINEIKNPFIEKRVSYFQNDDQQQLITFIQNQITNHQWPLQEYIGIKGQRAWRALKLAAEISNLDSGFMLHYHNDLDWISTEDDLGSFGERTYLIIRNFKRRIKQQKLFINKNSC